MTGPCWTIHGIIDVAYCDHAALNAAWADWHESALSLGGELQVAKLEDRTQFTDRHELMCRWSGSLDAAVAHVQRVAALMPEKHQPAKLDARQPDTWQRYAVLLRNRRVWLAEHDSRPGPLVEAAAQPAVSEHADA